MAKEVWNRIVLHAKKRLPESQFDMWIKPLTFIKLDDNVVYVSHPNPLAASFIEKEFKGFFEETLRELQIEGLSVSVLDLSLTNGEELILKQEALSSEKKTSKTPQFVMSLNPLYTFENFVPTHTNQFAYATS
ncbi:MAG: hypothetical protein N2445_03315, partial [Acidobacteria bacterium]|nr:hypothetical protein [Acidobacteriota bacterium]